MSQPSTDSGQSLRSTPSSKESSRALWDVFVGDDEARPIIEAITSGDNTLLEELLSPPQWTEVMLETTHVIYDVDIPTQCNYLFHRPSHGPDGTGRVYAMSMRHLERAIMVAAWDGQVANLSTMLRFAAQQKIEPNELIDRKMLYKALYTGNAPVVEALAQALPTIINFPLGHGTRPLYEAVRMRQVEVTATLLRLGANPLRPVGREKVLGTYASSMLGRASMAPGPRLIEMLLEYKLSIAGSGALHSAAGTDRLENMRVLIERGADVNERLADWRDWTPMHFAAWRGRVDAIAWLKDNGARSDMEDKNGKIPAQILEEFETSKANDSRKQPAQS